MEGSIIGKAKNTEPTDAIINTDCPAPSANSEKHQFFQRFAKRKAYCNFAKASD